MKQNGNSMQSYNNKVPLLIWFMASFAISASFLLNELSPLVAKFKIGFTIAVDMQNLTVVLLFSALHSRKLTTNGVLSKIWCQNSNVKFSQPGSVLEHSLWSKTGNNLQSCNNKVPLFFWFMASFAISASSLLNKLSPLVAKFKIGYTTPVDMLQDHSNKISSQSVHLKGNIM